jgi:hypothetical protein
MSSLQVDNIQSYNANPPVIKSSSGAEVGTFCRAWVNFNGTGTVAIRQSFNVSSITDNGVGNYVVNFTTAMADANYARCVTAGGNTTTTASNIQSPYNSTPTTSALTISTFTTSWGATQDCNEVNVAIFR